MQNVDTENVHEGHYLPVCEQKQKHKHIVIQRLLCWHLSDAIDSDNLITPTFSDSGILQYA